jgi:hypothetical protein
MPDIEPAVEVFEKIEYARNCELTPAALDAYQNNVHLRMFQESDEFSQYISFLKKYPIKSYIEIGVKFGGTFLFTVEHLRIERAVAVDAHPLYPGMLAYQSAHPFEFRHMDSRSPEFAATVENEIYDLCLIDGGHAYGVVKSDFNLMKRHARMIAFHDVANPNQIGVETLWRDVRYSYDNWEFFTPGKRMLGIGVILMPEWNF